MFDSSNFDRIGSIKDSNFGISFPLIFKNFPGADISGQTKKYPVHLASISNLNDAPSTFLNTTAQVLYC